MRYKKRQRQNNIKMYRKMRKIAVYELFQRPYFANTANDRKHFWSQLITANRGLKLNISGKRTYGSRRTFQVY